MATVVRSAIRTVYNIATAAASAAASAASAVAALTTTVTGIQTTQNGLITQFRRINTSIVAANAVTAAQLVGTVTGGGLVLNPSSDVVIQNGANPFAYNEMTGAGFSAASGVSDVIRLVGVGSPDYTITVRLAASSGTEYAIVFGANEACEIFYDLDSGVWRQCVNH